MVPRVTRDPDIQFARRQLPLRTGMHPNTPDANVREQMAPIGDPVMDLMVPLPDVRAIRRKLEMSQKKFSETYRIPLGVVKEWENGRRAIDAAAAAYLICIKSRPDIVRRALHQAIEDQPRSAGKTRLASDVCAR